MSSEGPRTAEEHADWNENLALKYKVDAYHNESWAPIRWVASRRVHDIKASLAPIHSTSRVLEVGCGPGMVLEQFPECSLHGVDLSESSVQYASERLGDRAQISKADGESLPFEDESFDAVFCTEVLEHTLNPQSAAKECYRVLRPGGRLVITVPNERVIDFVKQVVRMIGLGRVLHMAAPDGSDGRYGHEWHLHYLSGREIAGWLRELGPSSVKWKYTPHLLLPFHHIVVATK